MGRYSNPVALHDAQVARFARLDMDARRGHQDLAIQGLADMVQLTGGRLSKRDLRRMGGPYARGSSDPKSALFSKARGSTRRIVAKGRKVRQPAPLLPINAQSNRLRRSMRLTRVSGGTQAFAVGPDASAGRSINVLKPGGTKNMVARGFWEEVRKRWKARNAAFVEHFIRDQRK